MQHHSLKGTESLVHGRKKSDLSDPGSVKETSLQYWHCIGGTSAGSAGLQIQIQTVISLKPPTSKVNCNCNIMIGGVQPKFGKKSYPDNLLESKPSLVSADVMIDE